MPRLLAPMLVAALTACAVPLPAPERGPLVIAHRGASGERPEHTLAAYALAIEQGADFIETDLVITRDGVLVARHENTLALVDADGRLHEATTDVHERPEFAGRRTTRFVDGVERTGWFVEDFSLAELHTLRARERLPALRPASARFDGRETVPTFDAVLALVARANAGARRARPVGVYAEIKHPSHFRALGLPLEAPLVEALQRHGLDATPVFVQSFEPDSLRRLRQMTSVPLVQLLGAAQQRPRDFVLGGDARTYGDLSQPAGLAEVAAYARGIGVPTGLVIPLDGDRLGAPTTLVDDAHRAGLFVHAYTFRAENAFLPDAYDAGSDPAAHGDMAGLVDAFLALGIDGYFTDHPRLGVQARDAARRPCGR